MKTLSIFALAAATFSVAACGTSDGSVDQPLDTDLTAQRHHYPPPPPPPPPQDSGVVADSGASPVTCDICTKTQACCLATSTSYCSFSADACKAYPPDQQHYYYEGCLVELQTIRGVRAPNIPAACQ